jgi:methylated-DNA-[protein]-cysteine S-methyltransferase
MTDRHHDAHTRLAAALAAPRGGTPPDVAAAVRRATARALAAGAVDVAFARLDTPVGRLVAARTERGLVRLAYEDPDGGPDPILDALAARLSPRLVEAPARLDDVRRELDEYFAGRRRRFEVPIDWSLASDFGRQVLRAISAIPFGSVRTYREIAAQAGNPRAVRAAGNACGANPVPIVIPCHRVLRSGGGLGGYTGGLDRKVALLRLEGALPAAPGREPPRRDDGRPADAACRR